MFCNIFYNISSYRFIFCLNFCQIEEFNLVCLIIENIDGVVNMELVILQRQATGWPLLVNLI